MSQLPAAFVHRSFLTRVVAGPGALAELDRELRALGCTRPVVLSARPLQSAPALGDALGQLRELAPVYVSGVPRHSSLDMVTRVVSQARESKADCLVAVGGGSVIDTAKAAAVALAEGEPLQRHATRVVPSAGFVTPTLLKAKLPIFSVPMTSSGAEMTPAFGVRDGQGHKLLFWDAQVASRVVILDGAVAADVPASTLLASAMNGLAHCIEALYANNRSPLSSVMAIEGFGLFERAIADLASAPKDIPARHGLLVAGHVGGAVLASAGSCLHHAICHVLGALSGAGHGELNSVILPHAVEFNAIASRSQLEPLRVGHSDAAARVRALQQQTGLPTRLRELGLDRGLLDAAARQVMHERGIANNPRAIDSELEIRALLERAW